MSQVRVAVLGAGAWGRNLVRNLHELGALAVVGDPDPTIRDRVAEAYPDVEVMSELDDVLATDISAVVVATPAPTHTAIALRVIAAGKDVFVEKPFALTEADAIRVVEAGEQAGRIVMAGHLLLYQPAINFMKEYLGSGAIGKVAMLHQERLNLGTVRAVENALWSLGVHDVAAILHLVGAEPERIDTWGQPILRSVIEDDMHLHMLFGGGTEAHIHASWLWPERRRRLTVVGTEAMVVYDEEEQAVTLHRRRALEDLTVVDAGAELLFRGDPQPLRLELVHFLTCVRDRTEPLSSGRSAIAVVRVLERSATQLRAFG